MYTQRSGQAQPADQHGVWHIGALVPLVLAKYADIEEPRSQTPFGITKAGSPRLPAELVRKEDHHAGAVTEEVGGPCYW
jgi:hypothetical protein